MSLFVYENRDILSLIISYIAPQDLPRLLMINKIWHTLLEFRMYHIIETHLDEIKEHELVISIRGKKQYVHPFLQLPPLSFPPRYAVLDRYQSSKELMIETFDVDLLTLTLTSRELVSTLYSNFRLIKR